MLEELSAARAKDRDFLGHSEVPCRVTKGKKELQVI